MELHLTDVILECIRCGVHVTLRPYYDYGGVSITLFGKDKKGVVLSITRHVSKAEINISKAGIIEWTIKDMLKELTE